MCSQSPTLGKIELHDNIDESKKTLNKILDKIEDENIRQDVEEKLDEILDDVELEDYDFLDEDDDFDTLLSDVKNDIPKKDYSKIEKIFQETKKEDSKLKMGENIEMKNLEKNEVSQEDYEMGESSFGDFADYNFFINNIEDPVLKAKVRENLNIDDIDSFDKKEEKMPKIKNAYGKSIINLWSSDNLDLNYWDGNIILDDRAKFDYVQKVNNLNAALAENNIHIDPDDLRTREFLDIKVLDTKSDKRQEINGYSYNGEKIISRNGKKSFYLNYVKKPAQCQKFIDDLNGIINNTARSQIAKETFFEGRATKDCANELIFEFRKKQGELINEAKNGKEMKNALNDANFLEKEISNIKKNLPFKDKFKLYKRTFSSKFSKFLKKIWKSKKIMAGLLGTLLLSTISILLSQLGVISISTHIKKAGEAIKKYANDVHEMGKRIIQSVQSLYRIPGTLFGFSLMGLGVFLQILYYLSYFAGGFSSGVVFEVLGTVVELALYFDSNIEVINEKAADILEETGNVIENAGIRSQKYISKNMPKWYYNIPKEERSLLQNIEIGAIKAVYKVAQGTQNAGEKIHHTAEVIRTSYYYMKIALILFFVIIFLIIVRDLSSLTIIKNGNKIKKSAVKRGKKT